ncbi:MAG: outer membrane beta-barrel protein [Myxococcales bacterium]|nr:outer membrane beta-barrel protein [Myxococcales bacterium]
MKLRACCLLLLFAGCTAAFRSSSGGTTARDGVSSGTSNSLYFADRGGLLTRAGLVALGLVGAMGSVQDVKNESHVTNNYDGTVTVVTKSSGTFNAKNAQEATDILNAASDPHQNFGGLTGGLEISSTKLGGDTSGWMFEFGYAYAKTFHNRWGFEGSVKLMFGGETLHDRMIKTFDTSTSETGVVTMMKGDASYKYFGLPVRVGVTYRVSPVAILQPFVKLEPNWYPRQRTLSIDLDPSPWHFGMRLTAIRFLYVELDARFSQLRESALGYGLEVGVAF